jgi:ribosomal protein L32
MAKRTSIHDLQGWDDAPDLDHLVKDKRCGKRATPAKARRRNRRYENRLLNAQVNEWTDLNDDDSETL